MRQLRSPGPHLHAPLYSAIKRSHCSPTFACIAAHRNTAKSLLAPGRICRRPHANTSRPTSWERAELSCQLNLHTHAVNAMHTANSSVAPIIYGTAAISNGQRQRIRNAFNLTHTCTCVHPAVKVGDTGPPPSLRLRPDDVRATKVARSNRRVCHPFYESAGPRPTRAIATFRLRFAPVDSRPLIMSVRGCYSA